MPKLSSPTCITAAFRSVMDATETGVAVIDQSGSFAYANPAAQSLFGCSLTSMSLADVIAGNLASLAPQVQYWKQHRAWSGRLLVRRQPGDLVSLTVNAFRAPASRPELIALLRPANQAGAATERFPDGTGRYRLTSREVAILQLLAEGFSDKEIGLVLGVSVWTVNKGVGSLLRKMDAASRTAACVTAIKTGMIN
jgi:DNA-binding CsgD family transcriptional regulator